MNSVGLEHVAQSDRSKSEMLRHYGEALEETNEKEAEAAMGLPPGVHSYAILPIGYPMGRFGPVGRGKLADIVYQDKWGEKYQAV